MIIPKGSRQGRMRKEQLKSEQNLSLSLRRAIHNANFVRKQDLIRCKAIARQGGKKKHMDLEKPSSVQVGSTANVRVVVASKLFDSSV